MWWKALHPDIAAEGFFFFPGHLTYLEQNCISEEAMAAIRPCVQLLKAFPLLCQKNSSFLQLENSSERSPSPCRDLTCVDTDRDRGLLRQGTSADSCYSANCSSFSTYCCLSSYLIPGPFSLFRSPLHVPPESRQRAFSSTNWLLDVSPSRSEHNGSPKLRLKFKA